MKIGKTLVVIISSNDIHLKLSKLYFDKNYKKNKDIIYNIDLLIYDVDRKFKYKNKLLNLFDFIENNLHFYRNCLVLKDGVFIGNISTNSFEKMTEVITINLLNHDKLIGGFMQDNGMINENVFFINIEKIKSISYIDLFKKILFNLEINDTQILDYLKYDTLEINSLHDNDLHDNDLHDNDNVFYLTSDIFYFDNPIDKIKLNKIFKNNIIFYKFDRDYLFNKKLSLNKLHINNIILYMLYKNYSIEIDNINRKNHCVYYIKMIESLLHNNNEKYINN